VIANAKNFMKKLNTDLNLLF